MPFNLISRWRVQPVSIPAQPPRANQLMRPITPVQLFDSLRKAIHRFRVDQVTALPVLEGEAFAGWLTQQRVAEILASEMRRPDEILIA